MRRTATVWLVGMMGSGKSVVGRALAARLGWPFVDTDAEVERVAAAPIAVIFERDGEAGFRAREREAVTKVAGTRSVVALGGGAITQPGIAELLGRTGTVVHLRARPGTLLARMGAAEERPLLAGLAPEARLERLRALCEARASHYATATIVVDTDALEVDEVVEAVAARLPESAA